MELQHVGGTLQQKVPDAVLPKQQMNDIAHLYSQLQAAFDKTASTARSIAHKRSESLSNSVPSSTRTSSDTQGRTSTNASSPVTPHHLQAHPLMSCACHHWLVSVDSEHCAICDEPVKVLQQWQEERSLQSQTIERTQSQLGRLRGEYKNHIAQKEQLGRRIVDTEAAIEQRTTDIQALKQNLKILRAKCADKSVQVKEIQQSQEAVKRELEDLSQRLFEEANGMVKLEKEEKQLIEIAHEKVKTELQEAETEIVKVRKELQALRHEMEQLNTRRPLSSSSSQTPIRPSSSLSFNNHDLSAIDQDNAALQMDPDTYLMRAQIDMAIAHGESLGVDVEASEDDHCLMDFRQFMDILPTVPLRKIHSLPFMKQCIEDDVKPTLRFGPNPRTASRRILDAILVKTCFVEPCPEGFVKEQPLVPDTASHSLWERFSSSSSIPVFTGCPACGRHISKEDRQQVLRYRFRTSYFDEWTCIDRYCRDRIESVIQFYAFLRQLRVGAYKRRSLTDIYQECARLRLQMYLARYVSVIYFIIHLAHCCIFSRTGALPTVLQGFGLDTNLIAEPSTGYLDNNDKHVSKETTLSSSRESIITV